MASVDDFLTYHYLHSRFIYDEGSGKLYCKDNNLNPKNRRGKEAGFVHSHSGCDHYNYKATKIHQRKYSVHRLIWKMEYGEFPPDGMMIDHIDGNALNNRLDNLRVVTPEGNCKNTRAYKNNTSGVTGVFWNKQVGCWQASINSKGKSYHLGLHKSLEDAILARKNAEKDFNFHKNHGRKQ